MSAATLTKPASSSPVPTAGSYSGGNLLTHSLVLAGRSLWKTIRTPESLIDVTFQPIIFLLLFTYVFGGAITGGSQHEYLQYLLPGLLGQTIAMASMSVGVSLNSDIEKGIFDRFRSLPISRSAPLIGVVLADFVRYAVLFVVMIGTALIMGYTVVSWTGLVAALALCVAFSLCFAWISVFIGMTARTSGAVTGIMMLIVLPLSFGSSAFVPTSTMPGWMQSFADVNPISHLVNAVRALIAGTPLGSSLVWTLVWMAGLVVVFAPLAMRAYNRKA